MKIRCICPLMQADCYINTPLAIRWLITSSEEICAVGRKRNEDYQLNALRLSFFMEVDKTAG